MAGDEGAKPPVRSVSARRGPLQNPLQPRDLTHHALLRDLQPQTLPWAIQQLQRRLYDADVLGSRTTRRVALRQGFPLRWSAISFALGWFLIATAIVTGGNLGRSFQLPDGGGGTAQAVAPVIVSGSLHVMSPWLLGTGVLLLGASLLMSLCTRRYFFLVAQRNSADLLDVWVSGTSWRCEQQFDREFADFVRRLESHDRATHEEPQASHQGP
jgi:hypothetical protein